MKLCCYSVDSWSDFNRVVHVVHVFECELYIIFGTTLCCSSKATIIQICVTRSITLKHSFIFIMYIRLVIDGNSIILFKKPLSGRCFDTSLANKWYLCHIFTDILETHCNTEKFRNFRLFWCKKCISINIGYMTDWLTD